MRLYKSAAFTLFRLGSALIITFVLLTAVSLLHSFFPGGAASKEAGKPRVVETEVYKKEPPREKKALPRARPVTVSSQGAKAAAGESMTMKFSPDLGLDAGSEGDGVAMQSKELEAEVFEEGQTDEDVVVESSPPVPYPDKARDLGIEGEFVAIIVVNHAGKVSAIDIIKSPHQIITLEARKVIATWRFKAAKNKGVPVNVRKRITLNFKLD